MFIDYMKRDTDSSFYCFCRSVLGLSDGPAVLLISLRKLKKACSQSQLRVNLLYCLCLLVDWPVKALALEKPRDSDYVTWEVRGEQHGKVCEQIQRVLVFFFLTKMATKPMTK